MKRIVFLDISDVLDIHHHQIQRYGGEQGVRDVGLLQSAVAMPQAGFGDEYLHKDLAEMAAAYLFHIVCNHPFIDGNKRAGALAAFTFLELNDAEFDADEESFEELVMSVAKGETDKSKVTEWIGENIENT